MHDTLLTVLQGVTAVEQDVGYTSSAHLDVDDSSSEDPRLSKRWEALETGNSPYNQRMVGSREKLETPVLPGSRTIVADSGRGASIWILDSGIRISHLGFGGRANHFRGRTVSPYTPEPETVDDEVGHGTAVAGMITIALSSCYQGSRLNY